MTPERSLISQQMDAVHLYHYMFVLLHLFSVSLVSRSVQFSSVYDEYAFVEVYSVAQFSKP